LLISESSINQFAIYSPEFFKTEDRVFGDGISVRIYTPNTLNSSEKYPFMIYFHGGCYLFGNIAAHDQYIYELSKKSNLLIISIEYASINSFIILTIFMILAIS
jgi:acetyl esterase/lipase